MRRSCMINRFRCNSKFHQVFFFHVYDKTVIRRIFLNEYPVRIQCLHYKVFQHLYRGRRPCVHFGDHPCPPLLQRHGGIHCKTQITLPPLHGKRRCFCIKLLYQIYKFLFHPVKFRLLRMEQFRHFLHPRHKSGHCILQHHLPPNVIPTVPDTGNCRPVSPILLSCPLIR